jgi:hypothetical protein
MQATIRAAALVAAVFVSGCGDDGQRPDDGGTGADSGSGSNTDGGQSGVCGPPSPFSQGKQPTRTITVSSSTMPGMHASIEAAAAVATPGTRIQLLPGTHESDQFVANLRGTEAEPIWISGMSGAVISGGAQALQLQRPAYVVLELFEVANTTANGINIDDGGDFDNTTAGHHVVLHNISIHDVGSAGGNNDCLKVSGINNLYVRYSMFQNCGGGGSGIDHVGVHGSLIESNVFDGRMGNAVQSKGGSTDHDLMFNHARITGTRVFNMGGSTDLTLFRPSLSTSAPNAEARRIRAYDNIVWGLTAQATPFALVGCVDCIVAHNVVRGAYRWHLRILQETATDSDPYTFEPARDGMIANNAFEFSAATLATAVNVGGDTEPSTFQFRNNAWLAMDNPSQSMPTGLPTPEMGGVVGESVELIWNEDDLHSPAIYCNSSNPLAGMGFDLPIGYHGGSCPDSPSSIGPLVPACI